MNVGTTSIACAASRRPIARSILSSDGTSRPYPLLISQVVVPQASISSRRAVPSATSASSLAARVAATVDTIPPPAAAMLAYDSPARRRRSSPRRSPAKRACVCASTKPGTIDQSLASMTRVCAEGVAVRSNSEVWPANTTRPSAMASVPSSTIAIRP